MRTVFRIIFFLFFVWAGWASLSTGGLYELQQFNPDYVHPNKNVAYLISKISWDESSQYWDNYHVKHCSAHMPDWAKAKRCVEARIACDRLSPVVDNSVSFRIQRDIFSVAFSSCWKDTRPNIGPMALLRQSRALWRLGILSGLVWLTGGFDAEGQEQEEWIADNRDWGESLEVWMHEGI